MPVSKETLRTMVRDLNLIELSEEELDLLLPDVQSYMAVLEKVRALDLTRVPSARQMQCREEGGLK